MERFSVAVARSTLDTSTPSERWPRLGILIGTSWKQGPSVYWINHRGTGVPPFLVKDRLLLCLGAMGFLGPDLRMTPFNGDYGCVWGQERLTRAGYPGLSALCLCASRLSLSRPRQWSFSRYHSYRLLLQRVFTLLPPPGADLCTASSLSPDVSVSLEMEDGPRVPGSARLSHASLTLSFKYFAP